jgi:hypothetical protein
MFARLPPARRRRDSHAPLYPRSREHYDDNFLVNCPRCRTPLTLRMGAAGPYYHCRCVSASGDRNGKAPGR